MAAAAPAAAHHATPWLGPARSRAQQPTSSSLLCPDSQQQAGKLRDLCIWDCRLPAGVWQHVLPAGRQLPHLQSLDVSGVWDATRTPAVPDVSRVVRCCPGLQTLVLGEMGSDIDLHLPALAQLAGLRALEVDWRPDGLLLQLTRLTQLTCLDFWCYPPPQSVADKARREAFSWHPTFQSKVGAKGGGGRCC